jgi:hypothetical protein
MAKPWSEVENSPAFTDLTINQQEAARQQYFAQVVAPKLPADKVDDARSQFDYQTKDTGVDDLVAAITHVESGGKSNALSPQGASGSMQIMPATFKQYAQPGESYDNDDHRRAAATRKIADDYNFYGGDLAQTAAAYIGGRGAVDGDGNIRTDIADKLGTTPAAYANMVLSRIDANQAQGAAPPAFASKFDPTSVPAVAPAPDQSAAESARLAALKPESKGIFSTAADAITGLFSSNANAAESQPIPSFTANYKAEKQAQMDDDAAQAGTVTDAMGNVSQGLNNAQDPAGPKDVGIAESFGRGLSAAGAATVKMTGLAVAAPVVLLTMLRNAVTGSDDTTSQDAIFRNFVDPAQNTMDWAAVKPDEKQTIVAKVASGLGGLAADLPLMMAGGYQANLAKGGVAVAEAAPGVAKYLAETIGAGFDAMRPLMIKGGVEKFEEMKNNGATTAEAIAGAGTAALMSSFYGSAPMSLEGTVFKRLATGVPIGAVTTEIGRQIQNAAMPEKMQTPFSLENLAVGTATQALTAGAMGHAPLGEAPSRAAMGYFTERPGVKAETVADTLPGAKTVTPYTFGEEQPAQVRPADAPTPPVAGFKANAPSSTADLLTSIRPLTAVKEKVEAATNVDDAIAAANDAVATPVELGQPSGLTAEQQSQAQDIQTLRGSDALEQHLSVLPPEMAASVRNGVESSLTPTQEHPPLTVETLPQQILMAAREEVHASAFHPNSGHEREMLGEAFPGMRTEHEADGTATLVDANGVPIQTQLVIEADRRNAAGQIDQSLGPYNNDHIAQWDATKAARAQGTRAEQNTALHEHLTDSGVFEQHEVNQQQGLDSVRIAQAQAAPEVAGLNEALRAIPVEPRVDPVTGENLPAEPPVQVHEVPPPTDQHAMAIELGNAFDTPVHIVNANPMFDGVAHDGKVYISASEAHPAIAIVGHEMTHNRPEVAAQLQEFVSQYLHPEAVDAKQASETVLSGAPVSRQHALDETMADVNGAMWLDPKFWGAMKEKDPQLFRQAAYTFMEMATKAVNVIRGSRFDAERMVTDVDKVRDIIAQTWADHFQGKDADAVGVGVDPRAKDLLLSRKPKVDTGEDIPPGFFRREKVDHDVWIEDEGKSESMKVSARDAVASLKEDIDSHESLLECMRG